VVHHFLQVGRLPPSDIARKVSTPGSRSPERVLMGRPAAGVNAMLVSMLRPSRTAATLAPLPRCARMTRPCSAGAIAQAVKLLQQEGVRQTVESVAPHTLRLVAAGNRQYRRDSRHGAMKGRVEACHLVEPWKAPAEALDELDLLRQMLRVVGNRGFQLLEQPRRDPCRLRMRHAVHDAVTYRAHLGKSRLRFEPLHQRVDRRSKASRIERDALRLLSRPCSPRTPRRARRCARFFRTRASQNRSRARRMRTGCSMNPR
jgi:hypothetical protein